jgi:DnaK suppressor protein
MIDKKALDKIRKKLEKQKKRYLEILEKIRKYPDYGISEDDNILEMEEFEESLGLRKNILNALREVKRALSLVKKNRYGTCTSCKKPINPERLKIYPTASLCVKCKSAQTKKRRWLRLPWRR